MVVRMFHSSRGVFSFFKQVSFQTNSEAAIHALAPPLSAARALADGPALAGPGEIPRPDQRRRASE